MLGVAAPTPYDLRFRLLGIPVRVHPLFWLVMALISGHDNNLPGIAIFVACAFLSILVHEYGHGLISRALGYYPQEIVLYGMGGYCLSEFERQTPAHRLAVLIAGPGAGFALIGVLVLAGWVFLGVPLSDDLFFIRLFLNLSTEGRPSPALGQIPPPISMAYIQLIAINLLWGLLNLLPIWPLDGGRITEVLLKLYHRHNGTRWTHVISLLTAGIIAVVFIQKDELFSGLWFAYFGFINYQALQSLHYSARYSAPEDDADWWKR